MPIFAKSFTTSLDQYAWITTEIKKLLAMETEVLPSEIAVIARKHSQLVQLSTVMQQSQIPIFYERNENVLAKKEIQELIVILRFVDSLNQIDLSAKEELLPAILASPFFSLDPVLVFELSETAYAKKQSWMQTMLQSSHHDLKLIAEFLCFLASKKYGSLENLIDCLIGGDLALILEKQEHIQDEADQLKVEEFSYDPSQGKVNKIERNSKNYFISPFKWFYFDRHSDQYSYYQLLSWLQVFTEAIRGFASSAAFSTTAPVLSDLINFVDLLESRGLPLPNVQTYGEASQAVSLLTAHKAKGLEFEYVFVVDCVQEVWVPKNLTNKVGAPQNLELLPEGDNLDDKIRLFYVALTRAKSYLYVTKYNFHSDGKPTTELGFLTGLLEFQDLDFQEKGQEGLLATNNSAKNILTPKPAVLVWFESTVSGPDLRQDLTEYLGPKLDNYKLNVTHLNNFLNLPKGGPSYFLEQNLLRFPKAKLPNASYGTAMHTALSSFSKIHKQTGTLPSLDLLLGLFEQNLLEQRLESKSEEALLKKGRTNLGKLYQDPGYIFDQTDMFELDFSIQGVHLDQAQITGKIDKINFDSDSGFALVSDFKTGKSHTSWLASDQDSQIKLQSYHRQLVFYKLLVENSRDYGMYKVQRARLEFLDFSMNETKTRFLETSITEVEAEQLAKLCQVVYHKIMALAEGQPLPEVGRYTPNLKGVEDFIKDLLNE